MAGDGTTAALTPEKAGPGETTRRGRGTAVAALVALTFAVYAPNLRDYFLGDDFDLIGSFYGKPPSYFLRLLVDNASGDAWKDWGLDAAQGRGFLRPLHIWFLKLDLALWGTDPLGFHLTATIAAIAAVIGVFLVLERLGVSLALAFAGASAVTMHPILAAIVPFVAAREETLTTSLCLFAFYFFLGARQNRRSHWPALLCFALALLTKESAVAWAALPVGYDVLRGVGRATEDRRRVLGFYVALALVLLVYLLLRWAAFGNVVGGDGRPTGYLSLSAFASYHAEFWRRLLGAPLFDDHGVGLLRWLAPAAAGLLVALSFFRRRPDAVGWARLAVFFGPYWYLATTALFYGTYYDDRHHSLPLAGLVFFLALASERALAACRPTTRRLLAGAILGAAATLLLPATLRKAREFHEASRVTARVREDIERMTRGLPDGSAVLLVDTPLQEDPPFYFGWGLQSALGLPFTPSNAAHRLRIVDRRDRVLTRSPAPMPRRFDLTVRFSAEVPGAIESVSGP